MGHSPEIADKHYQQVSNKTLSSYEREADRRPDRRTGLANGSG
jgi:hypothetical protein